MWRSGERDSVIANATARVTKQFKEIGIGIVHRTACRLTSTSQASRPTKYTSIVVVYATASCRIQSLELDVFVIVSTSCDQVLVGARLAYRAILDEVTVK